MAEKVKEAYSIPLGKRRAIIYDDGSVSLKGIGRLSREDAVALCQGILQYYSRSWASKSDPGDLEGCV